MSRPESALTNNILQSIEIKINETNKINSGVKLSLDIANSRIGGLAEELKKQTVLLTGILTTLQNSLKISGKSGDNQKRLSFLEIIKITNEKNSGNLLKNAKSFDILAMSLDKLVLTINSFDQKKWTGLYTALNMVINSSAKLLLFSTTLAITAPLFSLAIKILSPALIELTKSLLYVNNYTKQMDKASKALLIVATPIALITFTIVSASLAGGTMPNTLLAFTIVAGSISLLGIAMYGLSLIKKDISETAKSLLFATTSIAVLALTIVLIANYGGSFEETLKAFMVVAVSVGILGIALYTLSFVDKDIKDAAKSLLFATLSIGLLCLTVYSITSLFNNDLELMFKSFMTISISVSILALILYTAGKNAGDIIKGSLVMLVGSISLLVFAKSLDMFKKSGITNEDLIVLGLAYTTFGLALSGAGLIAPVIAAGAAAMLLGAASLMVFTNSLKTFKETKWNEVDSSTLGGSIKSIVSAFKDSFADLSISDLLKITAGTLVLGAIGNSISTFASGLSSFQNMESVEYETKTDENGNKYLKVKKSGAFSVEPQKIADMIKVMVESLTTPLSDLGSKSGMFINSNFENGLDLLGKLGNSISQFATGLTAFQNMNIVDYTKDSNGNLIATTKGPNSIDPQKISDTIKLMIDSLSKPLSEMGKLDESGLFTTGYIGKGLDLLGNLGNSVSEFAKGLIAFQGMNIVEYTKDSKGNLVTKIKGANSIDPQKISDTITLMVNSLTKPLQDLGKADDGGVFSSSDISKGIEMLETLAKPITFLSKLLTDLKPIEPNKATSIGVSIDNLLQNIGNGIKGFALSTKDMEIDTNMFDSVLTTMGNNFPKIMAGDLKHKETSQMFIDIAKGINSIDMNKLKMMNKLAESMARMAESIHDSSKEMKEVFKDLASVIAEISGIKLPSVSIQGGSSSSDNQSIKEIMREDNSNLINAIKEITMTLQAGIETRTNKFDLRTF